MKKKNKQIFKNPNEKIALMSLCLIFIIGYFTKFLFHSLFAGSVLNTIIQFVLTYCLILIVAFQVLIGIIVLSRLIKNKFKK